MKKKMPVPILQLDATKFRFEPFDLNNGGAFAFLERKDRPMVVRDVEFINLEKTDHTPNGVDFSFYGTCEIIEHAAVELDDGTYMFCIVSGHAFHDTFSPADEIKMRYYNATPI